MATQASSTAIATYDLMLLLDVAAEEKARAGVLKEVQGSITADGELLRHDRWGVRELAYPIEHKQQAEYHLLQFRPGTTALLDSLDRSLRITDGVIRFRIVKLRPGTPEAPSPPPAGQVSAESAPAPERRPAPESAAGAADGGAAADAQPGAEPATDGVEDDAPAAQAETAAAAADTDPQPVDQAVAAAGEEPVASPPTETAAPEPEASADASADQ